MRTAKADARLFAKTGSIGTEQKRSVFRLLASVGLRRIVRSETTVKSMLVSRGVIPMTGVTMEKVAYPENAKQLALKIPVQTRNIRRVVHGVKVISANVPRLLARRELIVKPKS